MRLTIPIIRGDRRPSRRQSPSHRGTRSVHVQVGARGDSIGGVARVRLALRRLVAWGVDWVVIAGYAALLVPLGLAYGTRAGFTPLAWNAVAFWLLIVPVTVWLAAWERGPRAGSPGKRLLHLRVVGAAGEPPGFGRALARNALKVALPWELGHTAAFSFTTADPGPAGWIAAVLANGLALLYIVSLFLGDTPYNRVTRTRVVRAN